MKRYVPIFKCKNCGEKFNDDTQEFSAEDIQSVKTVLNVKYKGNAPLHCCSDIT